MTQERRAMLQMLACAMMWSLSGVLIKLLPWHPLVISGVRCLLAAIVLGIYMRIRKIRLISNRKTWLLAACISLIYICYIPAARLTTAANAIVLQYTAPVYVLLFSAIFLKKRVTRMDALAVLFTMLGMALFFFDQLGGGSLLGNMLALLSGVFLGSMFFIVSGISEEERLSGILLAQVVSALIGLPFLFAAPIAITPAIVMYMLLLGIVQLGLPYILYTHAAQHCPALTCSLLSMIEPMLNPVWVFLAVGEQPSLFALAGGAVVLITILLWNIWQQKQKEKTTEPAETMPPVEQP